jgi:predicted dehydrogenase
MINIGIVGCGLQAATIAGYLGIYGDDYQVSAIMDTNPEFADARIKEKQVVVSSNLRHYGELNDFIENETELDGIIIGSPCSFHTEIACELEKTGIPLYLEKPVAITLPQLEKLYSTFKDSLTPVQVSLPMRICPLTEEVKSIIDSGKIGSVEQVVGYEDTCGEVYFSTWFRDFDKTGGMFMQKAVHDIDYMLYLAGSAPREVCGMRAQRVFRGNKPFDLSCDQCDEQKDCLESPYNYFHKRCEYKSVDEAMKYRYGRRMCRFSKGIKIDDLNSCIIELESGAQITHTQNFLVRHQACRRGARFYGYRGTIEMIFSGTETGTIKIMSHMRNQVEKIEMPPSQLSHYGGDKELVFDFIETVKSGKRARTDLISGNGIYSTLACLCARKSADRHEFIKVSL